SSQPLLVRVGGLERLRQFVGGRHLEDRFGFPRHFLFVDDQRPRQQLNFVPKQIKRHHSRQERQVLVKHAAKHHLLERAIKGDALRQIASPHLFTGKKQLDR